MVRLVASITTVGKEMTKTSEFQVSYGQMKPVQAAAAQAEAPLYAAIDAMVAPLSSDEYAFIAKDSGERHVLSHHVLQTLDQCREFRPIDEHAARVASVVPGLTQQDRIRKGLEGLATAGLLVKDSDYLDRLKRAPEASPRTLHAIYIRACDRPQQLKKLLDSLANYERKFRVARPVVLLDDSTDARNQDQNRDLLREFARAVGNPVSYFGPSERQRLRERLLKAVPGCEKSLEWLLDRGPRTRRPGGGRSCSRQDACSRCSMRIFAFPCGVFRTCALAWNPIHRLLRLRDSIGASKMRCQPGTRSRRIRLNRIWRFVVPNWVPCSASKDTGLNAKACAVSTSAGLNICAAMRASCTR